MALSLRNTHLDILLPLLAERRVVQHGGHNARSRDRRVGVHGSCNDLELRLDVAALRGGLAHHRETSDALAVQSEILRETLGHCELMTVSCELTQSHRVLDGVTRSEACTCARMKRETKRSDRKLNHPRRLALVCVYALTLVSRVEDHIMSLGLDSRRDLLPLFRCRVNSRRVVCARMEQEDALRGRCGNVSQHTLEIQSLCGGLVILVVHGFESCIVEDGKMVAVRKRATAEVGKRVSEAV